MGAQSGYGSNGLPYARLGDGDQVLVIFSGSELENKPLTGLALPSLQFGFGRLASAFTVYMVSRKPGLPSGYTAQDMSNDFADMIRADIGKPVHVMGISSGGSSVLHFAADHPDLTERLIVAFSGYRMTEHGITMCQLWRDQALAGRWLDLYESMGLAIVEGAMPDWLVRPMMRYFGAAMLGKPKSGSDFAILLDADINLKVLDKLPRITAPTLVIGGDRDPFYSQEIMRETTAAIPNAKLELLSGGHSAMKSQSRQFERQVLHFLNEEKLEAVEQAFREKNLS
jgi:pimeloyl-ACP methyl ester carboxylesterase